MKEHEKWHTLEKASSTTLPNERSEDSVKKGKDGGLEEYKV